MKRARDPDQHLREIGVDPPIMGLVGGSQSRASHFSAEPHVIELATHRPQTSLDVSQTLPVCELSEGHRQHLIPAGESPQMSIATIPNDAFLKLFVGQILDQLRKDSAAKVHPPFCRPRTAGPEMGQHPISNRSPLSSAYPTDFTILAADSGNLAGHQWFES